MTALFEADVTPFFGPGFRETLRFKRSSWRIPPASGFRARCGDDAGCSLSLQAAIDRIASARPRNQLWFRHSSRSFPLKLSMNAFRTCLPGWMKRSSTPAAQAHWSRTRLVNSQPLSRTMLREGPRPFASRSSIRATRAPGIDRPTSIAIASRIESFTTRRAASACVEKVRDIVGLDLTPSTTRLSFASMRRPRSRLSTAPSLSSRSGSTFISSSTTTRPTSTQPSAAGCPRPRFHGHPLRPTPPG